METPGEGIQITRRRLIEGAVALIATAAVGCSGEQNGTDEITSSTETATGATSDTAPATTPTTTAVEQTAPSTTKAGNNSAPREQLKALYVPLWTEYNKSDALPGGTFNHLLLSFAEPNGEGLIEPKVVNNSTKALLGKLAVPGAAVSLAIGGWGLKGTHEKILEGFRAAAKKPDAFALSVAQSIDAMRTEAGLDITGVDLDWEYPEKPGEAAGILGLARSIKAAMPGVFLSIAVPSYIDSSYASSTELWQTVDQINVMTYDYDLDGSGAAKSIAPTPKVVNSIRDWVQLVGDEQKIVAGLPTYGHRFPLAKKAGDVSPSGKEVFYDTMPKDLVAAIPLTEAEPGYTDSEGWVSAMPPLHLAETVRQIRQNHPNIGGFFYWSAMGLVPEHAQLIQ